MIAGMEAEPQQPGDIAARSVRSSAYTVTGSIIQTAVGLVRMILLARLLDSVTFGAYTFALSVVGITQALPLFGMPGALIHRTAESEGEIALQTHFSLNLAFSTTWAVLIAMIGPHFMALDERWVLWIFLATQYVDNLAMTGMVVLMRRVVYRRIALVQTLAIVLGTGAALVLAWKGLGLWALLATDIAAAGFALVGYVLYQPGWRYRLGWSTPVARYLLSFGSRTLAGSVLTDALERVDNLWTGHYLGQDILGYYSRAFTFGTYPRKILAAPLTGVALSTYAALKGTRQQLSRAFFWANAILVRSGFLFSGALALVAPEFIRLVIGAKWLPMLDAFRLMLLFTMLDPLRNTTGAIFNAMGEPEKLIWTRGLQLVTLILGMYLLGPTFGIAGVAISLTLTAVVGVGTQLWLSRRHVDFSLISLFGAPALALLVGMVLARAAILIPGVLGSDWRTAAVKLLVFSLTYLGILLLLERKDLPVMLKMVEKVLPKRIYQWSSQIIKRISGDVSQQ